MQNEPGEYKFEYDVTMYPLPGNRNTVIENQRFVNTRFLIRAHTVFRNCSFDECFFNIMPGGFLDIGGSNTLVNSGYLDLIPMVQYSVLYQQ